MASTVQKITKAIEKDLDVVTKTAFKNSIEALSKTHKSEELGDICKRYLQLFKKWQQKRQQLQRERAKGLQRTKSGTEAIHQQIFHEKEEELLNQEGERLLEEFQNEFGIHIDLLIATQLHSDKAGTYIQIGVPALQDVKKYQTAGKSGFGDIHINSSESFFSENENSIITIPIKSDTIENINKKDLSIYIYGINDYLAKIAEIMTINETLTANGLIKDGKGAIGRAAEMLIGSYLTYEHTRILYNYFQEHPKYKNQTLGSKEDYYTLGFNAGKEILDMLKPDNMSYFTTGDFEYSNLNNILLKNKFLFDLMESSNLKTKATRKIKQRMNLMHNIKYQIKQSDATVKYNTTNSYINMLTQLLEVEELQKVFEAESKEWFGKILSKTESAAAKDYFIKIVKEIANQSKIEEKIEQVLLDKANQKGFFTAGKK